MKIYVVGGDLGYANWLDGDITEVLAEADLVLFTGGEDVSPRLYNEPEGSHTYCNPQRDRRELLIFESALRLSKPMLGICRGAQLLCVLSGGRLVQDQENRYAMHDIYTSDGRVIPISSTHHQAQYPYDMEEQDYQVLAWTEGLSRRHLDGNDQPISTVPFKEVEIAYYPKTRCLAIQGHPEYLRRTEFPETFEYLDMLMDKLLNNKFHLEKQEAL